MKSVTDKKTLLFLFWMILFIIQNRLQQWCGIFQYVDELFAVLFFPLLVIRLAQKKRTVRWTKRMSLFWGLLLLFWMWGWGGYFRYHYQVFSNALKDSYLNLKFYLGIGASFLLFYDEQTDVKQLKRRIWPVLNGITAILFVLCVVDSIFGIFSTETRGGMIAVKLFYDAYTVLVAQGVFLSALYLWFFEEKQKKIILPLGMLAFIMLSTRRAKSMGAIACILLIYVFVFYKKQKINKKLKMAIICFVGIAAVAGIYQVVSYYFLMGVESARAVLTIGAPFLAWDHFPFGTGWATYGSAFSTEPYSPVYGMYRMAGVWGMSPDFHDFISDTYWPMLMGQCGYVGFAAFVGTLFLFVRKVLTLKNHKEIFAGVMLLVLYLFVSSSSESAFVNPIAVPFAFLIGFWFAEQELIG